MRRKSDEAGVSLDSLMDTLTNVVGILVIMLVVTQLGVRETVRRIYAALPEISKEEFDKAKKQAEELQQLLKEYGSDELDRGDLLTRDRLSVDEHKRFVADIKRKLAELAKKTPLDLTTVRQNAAKAKKDAEILENQFALASKELAALKALLAQIPVGKDPTPVNITLPNPRLAPPNTKPLEFAVRGGRIRPVDLTKLRQTAEYKIGLVADKFQTPKGVDPTKLTKHFNEHDFGDDFFRLKFKAVGGRPYIVLEDREKRGNNIEGLMAKNSLFKLYLSRVDPRKNYLRFRVWSDSFDTYLVARTISSRVFAAGWEPYPKTYEWLVAVALPENMKLVGAPPPPKPNPNAKKPNPKTKAPLPIPQID